MFRHQLTESLEEHDLVTIRSLGLRLWCMTKKRGYYTPYSQTTEYKENNIGTKGPSSTAANQNILLLDCFFSHIYIHLHHSYLLVVNDAFIFILILLYLCFYIYTYTLKQTT